MPNDSVSPSPGRRLPAGELHGRRSLYLLLALSSAALATAPRPARAQQTDAAARTSPQPQRPDAPKNADSRARARKKRPLPPPQPPVRRWLLDGHIALSGEIGGDDLGPQPAGEGVSARVGAALMPLWLGEHGFGLGAEIGMKYAGMMGEGGGLSIRRFPLVLSAQALLSIANHWHIALAGGLQWDLEAQYMLTSAAGDRAYPLSDGPGWMGELGMLWVSGRLAVRASLRYTAMHYRLRGAGISLHAGTTDASSLGLVLCIHYLL